MEGLAGIGWPQPGAVVRAPTVPVAPRRGAVPFRIPGRV
jgi:hypothetical protein